MSRPTLWSEKFDWHLQGGNNNNNNNDNNDKKNPRNGIVQDLFYYQEGGLYVFKVISNI